MNSAIKRRNDWVRLLAGQIPQTRDDTPGSPPLAEMLARAAALPAEVYHAFAFASEPLAGRIPAEKQRAWAHRAETCGVRMADELTARCPDCSPDGLAKAWGLPVTQSEKAADSLLPIFAQYHAEGRITLFVRHARAAQQLADDLGFPVAVQSVLLAHELFHHLEQQQADSLFTQSRPLRLGRGPFARGVRVACLSEIGAMAFSARLLGLAFPARAMDVLLLYTVSPAQARGLYRFLLDLAGNER